MQGWSRVTVQCAECDFRRRFRRDDGDSVRDAVREHAEETGHRLRITDVSDDAASDRS